MAEPIEPEDWEGLKPRPAGPDPARDARIDAYRDRERRRAVAALDRYIDTMFTPTQQLAQVAGERFVEAVGDYVLARLGKRFDSSGDPMCEQTGCQGGKHVAPCVYEVPPRMAMDADLPLESPVRRLPDARLYAEAGAVPDVLHPSGNEHGAWVMQHNRHYGVRPGPECTCVQASDTGHDPDCPRAAFARGAAPHNADYVDTSLHGEGLCDRSCCTPMSEVYRMDGRRADGTRPA